jgi:hypothetical protein
MDDQLKSDIETEFHAEYYAAEKAKKTGFWKKFDEVNDGLDAFFSSKGLSSGGVLLAAGVVLAIANPWIGVPALCAWAADMVGSIAVSINDHAKATQAVKRDIDNGSLPERYNDVIDARVKELGQQIESYTAQKAQLPPKGTAAKSFAAAVSGDAPEAATPAPSITSEAAPKL